jgi:lipopolysaccharide transport system ATP-binding protein
LLEEIRSFDRTGSSSEIESELEGAPTENLGSFDPGLQPESTSEYERLGAEIQNIKILNSRGDEVNILDRGGEYTYSYEVLFTEAAYGIRFGMMVKAQTGLEIAGQVSHAAHEVLEHIPANHRARVGLPFRADLASGTYFVNAGVMGVREGEMIYLHRILDAIAFRISPVLENRVTGRVDLTLPGQWTEINPEEP